LENLTKNERKRLILFVRVYDQDVLAHRQSYHANWLSIPHHTERICSDNRAQKHGRYSEQSITEQTYSIGTVAIIRRYTINYAGFYSEEK